MDQQLAAFEVNLKKTIEHLKSEFGKLQTGRASAALVEGILVEAYGQMQPLKAVSGISVQDAKTLLVQPWDKSILADVEKALIKANLGCMPTNEGAQIRLVFPPMTEERRKQLVKIVKELAEEAKISVRQQRQEIHTSAKKDTTRSEDEHRTFEGYVQKAVDQTNEEIEELAKKKEEDVMKI
ncbi:MAG TPA: ribosome recycling factor [Candidatus Peribacterales bacterium]|nr:ribosome recycling factor [Candidatus Peribacterales bacterium]